MLKLIPIEQYCPVKRPLNIEELIKEAVQKEDAINHRGVAPMGIPPINYPKAGRTNPTGMYVFIKGLLP